MDEAWRLEEEFWQAGTSGRVQAYYARVLTSDAFVVVPGAVLTREELMRQWDHRSPWDDWEMTERRTALVNGETIVLSYRIIARSVDTPLYKAQVSTVYTWVGQHWALAMRQHTPEPEPDTDTTQDATVPQAQVPSGTQAPSGTHAQAPPQSQGQSTSPTRPGVQGQLQPPAP